MRILALYVYHPTTFVTDSRIEPMVGAPTGPGEVTLSPGIYRTAGNAAIRPTAVPEGAASYSVIMLENSKDGPPDPPISAIAGYAMSEISAFFGGTGEESEI